MTRSLLAAAVLASSLLTPLRAQEARLLAEEPSGIVPLDDERRIRVERIEGQVQVTEGALGKLTFESVYGEAGQPLPIALWSEGSTLRFLPVEGARAVPRVLRLTVPAGILLDLPVSRTKVVVHGVRTQGLTLSGAQVDADLEGITGPLALDLHGGTVRASGVDGELTFQAERVSATIENVGEISGRFTGGGLAVRGVRSSAEVETEDAGVQVSDVSGVLTLRARRGQAEVRGLKRGAEMNLSAMRLRLLESAGPIRIETDSGVEFGELKSDLSVTAFGGVVSGQKNTGSLEVKGSGGTEVRVEGNLGPVRLEGDGLQAYLKDTAGDLRVATTYGTILAEGIGGALTVDNQDGNVSASQVRGDATVKSRGGDVRILGVAGAVQVTAESGTVEVVWSYMPRDKDSTIVNEGGDVAVRLPVDGGCLLIAKSERGRVETDLPDLQVAPDRSYAEGMVRQIRRPTVRITALGDVLLGLEEAPPPPQPEAAPEEP